METPGSIMTDDLAQFDLALELRGAQSRKPWPSGMYSKTLVKRDDLRAVLFVMEPGAMLKEHHADGSITVQVLQGEILFRTQEQSHTLRTGQLLTLARSIKHSVESAGDAAFLLTISWRGPAEVLALKKTD
jgi:quercetin dioxygenase-like cupin family protein